MNESRGAPAHWNCDLARSNSQSHGQNFYGVLTAIFYFLAVPVSHCKICARYEQISGFEKRHSIGLKEAGWTNCRIVRHLGRSDVGIRQSVGQQRQISASQWQRSTEGLNRGGRMSDCQSSRHSTGFPFSTVSTWPVHMCPT
ncbi:hypothetical protein TNCV_2119811 [Trichonephila clavipes]|nr:hypothetical protein TNCV_2119811 [Trichonephila clavipes]